MGGEIDPTHIAWPALSTLSWPNTFDSLAVMFWCFVGLEAFAHLSTEFRNPERDFPRALMIGMLIAGIVYWGCTVAILQLNVYGSDIAPTSLLLSIVADLFGSEWIYWGACLIGYLACFASVNIYTQGFARLVWSQAAPGSRLGRLSRAQVPLSALLVMVGAKSLYALIMLAVLWWGLPHKSQQLAAE